MVNRLTVLFFAIGITFIAAVINVSNLNAQDSTSTPIAPGTVVQDRWGIEMVYVPSGSFEMGIDRELFRELHSEDGIFSFEDVYGEVNETYFDLLINADAYSGFLDTYTVSLPAFWIDRYEVTIQQYESWMEVCIGTGNCNGIIQTPVPQQPVFVTWYNAQHFCIGRGARLPTEEEWEYAASGPENYIFPWGNIPEFENADANLNYEVGSKPGNVSWIGAYDMAGNAQEWVEDHFLPYPSPQQNWDEWKWFDRENERVIRGGGPGSMDRMTTYERGSDHPSTRGHGFRCARYGNPAETR
jgi:formylglycine-generating enzyme required for sulfatase activity